jgi:hypothetical protein
MDKPQTFRKKAKRDMRVITRGVAVDAIGKLEHGQDVYILTFGQFSLIDALVAILDQTGPADVVISSWTVADAHMEETIAMVESAAIRSLRMIVDRSFRTRQPAYFRRMKELFGADTFREVKSHSKFMVITNDCWNIVVRTSMNLNNNPRLENIEISESSQFADFMLRITEEIFNSVDEGEFTNQCPDVTNSDYPYRLVCAPVLEMEQLILPVTTHAA